MWLYCHLVSSGIGPNLAFLSLNFNLGCCEWWNQHDRRVATLEFDRDRKSMGVIVNSGEGKPSLLVKVLSLSGIK